MGCMVLSSASGFSQDMLDKGYMDDRFKVIINFKPKRDCLPVLTDLCYSGAKVCPQNICQA